MARRHLIRQKLKVRIFPVVASAALGALAFVVMSIGGDTAQAQGRDATAEADAGLAQCIQGGQQRVARYVLYKNKGEHVQWEGPFLLSKQEANAILPLMTKAAIAKHGAGATASIPAVNKPENCSFLYREKGSKTLSMAQGREEAVEKRRDEMVRFGHGSPLTETTCLSEPKADDVSMWAFIQTRAGQAYGRDQASACATAKRCMAEAAIKQSYSGLDAYDCECDESIGGLQRCTVKATVSRDTPLGVRG